MKILKKNLVSSAVAGAFFSSVMLTASGAAVADTEFRVGGYVKADFMTSRFDNGSIESGNIARDIYIPGATPVGGGHSETVTDFHIRESRLFMEASQSLASGERIRGYFEIDFLGTLSGDKRVTNSYSPRVRHAYIGYRNWLVGQSFTNFQDTNVLPESPDLIGTTDGTVFVLQPQVRYTFDNGWSVSVESPESTVTPYQGANGRITTGDSTYPDITASYSHQAGDFYFSAAGLLRQVEYRDRPAGISATETAYGINLGFRWNIGPHDIRASVVHGPGLGRYVGLNVANDAVLTEELNLDAIDVTGFTVAYRHVWSERIRTNLMYSRADIDNTGELAGLGANDRTERVGVNLMYQANERMVVGTELSRATRTLLNGSDGNMDRLQVSVQYLF